MNNLYPFNQDWFKTLSISDKCSWLVADTKARPALEFATTRIMASEGILKPVAKAFDEPQDAVTPATIDPIIAAQIISTINDNLSNEIHLAVNRAYHNGDKFMHSIFSIICLAHAQATNELLVETDVVCLDESNPKRQVHFANLQTALRWAFGSDNPTFANVGSLPTNELRSLTHMTKKVNGRSKLKFTELVTLINDNLKV